MSEVTILTMCEQDERFCHRIARRLGKESLYDIVVDDWRRPIVDGILASIYFYGRKEIDWKKLRTILDILGYEGMYEAIIGSSVDEVIEEVESKLKELMEEAKREIEELRKLL